MGNGIDMKTASKLSLPGVSGVCVFTKNCFTLFLLHYFCDHMKVTCNVILLLIARRFGVDDVIHVFS